MAAHSTSGKALLYFSERVEDATEAVKGLLSGRGNGAAGVNGFGGVANAPGSSRYLDVSDDALREQLESDRDDLRISGLRTIIAHISKGHDAAGYFASVVKLSSNSNLEIRKLVYCIVRRYARKQPDIALLGINSFQRDLLDRNEVVRMMALRVLTGLRLKMAASVVEYAINRSVRDTSFHVRRAAALSLIKCRDIIDAESVSTFRSHVALLLQDRHPSVLGAALVAWKALFSDDVALLHQHFRKLCYALCDMDEWAQHEGIIALAVYAKRCFAEPSERGQLDTDHTLLLKNFADLLSSRNPAVVITAGRALDILGRESYVEAAFKAACRHISATAEVSFGALIACLQMIARHPKRFRDECYRFFPRSSTFEPAYITTLKLKILVVLVSEDTFDDVLGEIEEQARNHPSEQVASFAVHLIGVLAGNAAPARQKVCVQRLLRIVRSQTSRDLVVSEALAVIEHIIAASSNIDAAAIVYKLSTLLFSATSPISKETSKKIKIVGKSAVRAPVARGYIYWLLGQYCRLPLKVAMKGAAGQENDDQTEERTLAELIGLDTLRLAAINFVREGIFAKLQVITLSTKVVTVMPGLPRCSEHFAAVSKIHAYIMQLARYDEDYDVRDRARFCKALTDRAEAQELKPASADDDASSPEDKTSDENLGGVILRRSQVEHVLFEGKISATSELEDAGNVSVDIFEIALGKRAADTLSRDAADFVTEAWADKSSLPPSSVRDPPRIDGKLDSSAPKSLGNTNGHASGTHTPVIAHPHANLLRQNDMRAASPATPSSQAAPQYGAKYKDLDDFLNASSDDGEQSESDVGNADAHEELEEEESEEEEEDNEEEATDEDRSSEDEDEHAKAPPDAQLHLPTDEENAWAS